MLATKLSFDRMMDRNLWYWLVMMLNLAVSDMFEDMCGYLMMKRDDRGFMAALVVQYCSEAAPTAGGPDADVHEGNLST